MDTPASPLTTRTRKVRSSSSTTSQERSAIESSWASRFQNDCVSAPDASLAFINSTTGDELDVELDIIQETISNSVHYIDLNGTAAIIGFCLRVDYNYVDGDGFTESINFTRQMSPSPLT
jgi:hypothetical protein